MKSAVNAVVAVALLAAIVVAGVLMESRFASQDSRIDALGHVSEVVVKADMPRLYTDTVYVSAGRSVAAIASPLFAN